jgi:hypothetical protein
MNLIPGAISFLLGFLAFLRTTTGAFFPDDSPWTMAAVIGLEHQHPPGYPLYTLLARTWAVLPLGGISFRLNLLSATLMALAGVLLGHISSEYLRRREASRPARLVLFISTALIFDLSWTGWEQALSFKGGVYALNTIITLGILGLSTGLLASKLTAFRLMASLALLTGLGLAHHWMTILVNLPLAVIPFLWWRRDAFSGLKKPAYLAVLLLLGVSTYLFLPIRSSQAFVNWGAPGDLRGFIDVVSRAQYRSEERNTPTPGYWGLKARYVAGFFLREWTSPLLFLALAGLVVSLTLLPRETMVLFLSLLFTAFSVFWYDLKPPDCFYSRAHFYLPVIAVGSMFIAMSVFPLWLMAGKRSRYFLAVIWLSAVSFQLSAGKRMEAHNLSQAYVPYDYAKNILDCTPYNAYLLCEGEGDWFPCLYQVRGEQYRADVTPLNYYLMRKGYRPFLKAYSISFPGLISREGRGYSMNPRPFRPIAATIEVDDPSFPGYSCLSGLVRFAPARKAGEVSPANRVGGADGYSPSREKQASKRLRSRGVYDVEKLTEMYKTYAQTAVESIIRQTSKH